MSGWRLSAGDLHCPHCLGEVERRILVDTAFVLGELTCPSTMQYCYSLLNYMSGWRLSADDLDFPHCLGEVKLRRLLDATFVVGELTCPSTMQYC